MQNGGKTRYAEIAVLTAIAVLLAFVLVQLHHVEERLIAHGQQIRALGEATERLAATGLKVTGGSAANEPAAEEPKHVLHPDVPNYLKPRDKHWPPAGASLEGTLFRGWSTGDPKGFNPLLENGAEIGELVEAYVTTPIADMNGWTNPDDWHGELATRVEVTDDFKEFTIYLRRGVKWARPVNVNLDDPKYAWLKGDHEVTAQDLVFTLDIMMNPQVQNGFLKNYYKELESWKALDDYTLVVRWKKKQYINVAQTLGFAPIPKFIFAYDESGTPLPKETLGLRFNEHWYNHKGYVGSGAYEMAAYEPGARIRLVRNDAFYGDKPAIKEVSYPIYTDPTQTLLKLKAHELSIGQLTPGQYREEIEQYERQGQKPPRNPFFDGRIEHRIVDQPSYRYIGWNADKPIFSDKRVRRAMTYAFDRKALIENVFVGLGEITTGPFLRESPYNDASIPPIPFDLEEAKKLLAEAGWKDTDGDGLVDKELRPGDGKRTPFVFTLLIPASSKEYAAFANVFKDDLLKVGVKMNIDSAEWSLMQKRMEEKAFDAYAAGWLLSWDVDLYQIWHSSQADIPKGSNRVGFRNKEADEIIEKLRVTFDQDERIRLAHRFHHIVDEEQPYTFFMEGKSVFCWWSDVKNVEFQKVRPIANTLPWWVARAVN
jgi:ABC-type transport system substrate-binding protein